MATETIFRSPSDAVSLPTSTSVSEYICRGIPWNSSKIALVDSVTGKNYTYGEFKEFVPSVGIGLLGLGIRKGDVVMLLLPNCPEYPILFLGITSIGAIVTTANPSYTESEVVRQINDSGAKIVITLSALAEKTSLSNVRVVYLDEAPLGAPTVAELFSHDGSKLPALRTSDDDTCALPYSSGTTGLSKGVMLTHRNLIANVAQHVGGSTPRIDYRPEDVILSLLPMFHIYSITAVNLCALKSGCTLVTMPRFDLHLLLHTASKYSISVAPIVPPVVLLLTKSTEVDPKKWSSLRFVVSGAAPLHADLEQAFQRKFPQAIIGQGYGLTESSPTLTLSLCFQKGVGRTSPDPPGSAGKLLPNSEAKIVHTATGASLLANQRGELWVRGPQVMKGYLNNPEATAVTLDSSGWLHTGDVGYFDLQGNLFLVDRVKELIKVKGFQVPPAELEGILVSHPRIADAAVIGKPDLESGEVPVAFVVKSLDGQSLEEAEVLRFVAKQVVTYKRLHAVVFVESVPKSASGKILRRELKCRL